MGSGSNINVWTEPWLSLTHPLAPIGPPTDTNRNLTVADLIDAPSADWNLEAIRMHLPQYEDQIRTIPLSQFYMKDELVWLPEKTGTYSTKTGYTLSKLNNAEPDLSFNRKKLIWGV